MSVASTVPAMLPTRTRPAPKVRQHARRRAARVMDASWCFIHHLFLSSGAPPCLAPGVRASSAAVDRRTGAESIAALVFLGFERRPGFPQGIAGLRLLPRTGVHPA